MHPLSSHALRVEVVLAALGFEYESKIIDLRGENHAPEFLALNPNAKVPVIEDEGHVLWESHAIMRYLCNKQGDTELYPADNAKRSIVEQWLDWNQTRLNPEALTVNFNSLILGEQGNKEAVKAAKENLVALFNVLDNVFEKQSFLAGELSLADISVFSTMVYIEINKIDITAYSHLNKWYENMRSHAYTEVFYSAMFKAYEPLLG